MQNLCRLFVLGVCLTVSIQAANSANILKVLRQIEKLASDDVGNGYTDLKTYKEEDFNVARVVNSLKEHFSGNTWGKCRFVVVVGREKNIQKMKDLKQSNTTRTANLLSKLNEEGNLKTIIAAHWDQKSGDAVACDVHLFEIYSNEGTRLVLEYSLTD